ncbi:hypothetical protein [Tuwongella immobilis]|uniref:Uncharacterized protein n=1 Tax=Tuwongella immobilis TaxID=692036 RepID=A0A6C2YPV4_9BACT|nr:hypothetical protein [Tuwongella immobilis]VIP03660.1 unnamed protein product [Tuwongella immobilis]VTS04688.1 unnamed protein product [Tuwongella immobilis]
MIPWARQFRRTNLLHLAVVGWLLFAQLQLAFGGFASQLLRQPTKSLPFASEVDAVSDDTADRLATTCQLSPMETCCCGLPGKCQCCQTESVTTADPSDSERSLVDRPTEHRPAPDDSLRSWRACSCHSPMGEGIAAIDHPQIHAVVASVSLRESVHRQPLHHNDVANDSSQSVELPPPRFPLDDDRSFLRATARMVLSQPARDLR